MGNVKAVNFRVSPSLCFKVRLSRKPCENDFFAGHLTDSINSTFALHCSAQFNFQFFPDFVQSFLLFFE